MMANSDPRNSDRTALSVKAWIQVASVTVALFVGGFSFHTAAILPGILEKARREWLVDVERMRDDMQRQLKALEALLLRHEAGLHQGSVTPRDLDWIRGALSTAREDWRDIRGRLDRIEAKLGD